MYRWAAGEVLAHGQALLRQPRPEPDVTVSRHPALQRLLCDLASTEGTRRRCSWTRSRRGACPLTPPYLRRPTSPASLIWCAATPILPLDAVVATAERLGAVKIATVDRKDFRVVAPAHCQAFELVPAELG